jgi:ABC-type bacteriocin/lantibiotic exporter with double-glycine peptidase domain
MVLESFGVALSENELRTLCDCTPLDGTDAWLAVEAARQLGFNATTKHNLSPTDLEDLLDAGDFPIVFVDLRPLDGIPEQHALVVIEMDANFVTVLDPLKGERLLPRADFLLAWDWQRNLTIIVKR